MSELTVNFHSLHYYHSFGLSTPTLYPLIITRGSPRTTRSFSLLLASLIVVVYTSCLFLNLVIFHVCLVLSIRIRYTPQSGLSFFFFFFACRRLVSLPDMFWFVISQMFSSAHRSAAPALPMLRGTTYRSLFSFCLPRGLAVVLTLATVWRPTAVLFEFVKPLCPALTIFFNPSLFLDLFWNVKSNHFLVTGRKDKFKCTWKCWKHFFFLTMMLSTSLHPPSASGVCGPWCVSNKWTAFCTLSHNYR